MRAHATSKGIVAKWKRGRYHADGRHTSWLKVKNPAYSQARDREDLVEWRSRTAARRRIAPELALSIRS